MQNKYIVGKMLYLSVATGGTYIDHCDLIGSVSGYCLYCMSGRVWQSVLGKKNPVQWVPGFSRR
jgi:hypothetical protein